MLRIITEKFMPARGEYFTNVYLAAGSSPAAAAGKAASLVDAERAIFGSYVLFTKSRIDDMIPENDNYYVESVMLPGLRPGMVETVHTALFNVGRCDFRVQGGGRPSRKYVRNVMENDTSGNLWSAGYTTLMNTYINTVIGVGLVDPQGNALISGFLWLEVAMRQVRRGSKKKDTQSSPSNLTQSFSASAS
jgi:hypothetical protein